MTCCPIKKTEVGGVRLGGSSVVDIKNRMWDGYSFVLPLDEFGNGSEDEYKDRTVNELHGTGGNGLDIDLVPLQDLGVFCTTSQHSDGRQFITLPSDGISETAAFTVSLWARIETFYQPRVWFSRGEETPDGDVSVFSFGHSFLNQLAATIAVNLPSGGMKTYELRGDTTIEQEQWYHLAATWEPGIGLKVYLDGVLDGELEVAETQTSLYSNGNYIMRWNEASIPTGNIQEVRLYPTVMSEDYLKAEHDNFCAPGFFSIGPETLFS